MPDGEMSGAWSMLREALEEDLQRINMVIEQHEAAMVMLRNMREDYVIDEETFDTQMMRHNRNVETLHEIQATIAGWIEEGDIFYR